MRRVAGIDVGGTFTDLLLHEAGPEGTSIRLAKVPTSAANQAAGVLAALEAAGVSPKEIDLIIHGTTTTTNAVLERKVAQVGLITTRGLPRHARAWAPHAPAPYGLMGTFEPLIPRELRLEVAERMSARGEVLTPLDEARGRARACARSSRRAARRSSSISSTPTPIPRTRSAPARSPARSGRTPT